MRSSAVCFGRIAKLVVVAAFGALMAGCGTGSGAPHTIVADFDNADGLYVGNKVSVLGMPIGRIERITPRSTGVEISMSVDGSIALPAAVQAVTVSDSILTDRHIELSPVYRGGPVLPARAVLDREHTRTPVEFDGLLAMTDKLATSLGGDGQGHGPIADLLAVGDAATAGNGDAMRSALGALSAALRTSGDDGAATRDAVTKVVTNLDALSDTAARNDTTLRDFGTGMHQLADLLAEENLGSGDTGGKLRDILVTATDLLQQNQPNIAALTGNSATLTKSLADYDRNIAEFLDVFPLVTDNVYNAIDHNAGALRATVDLNRVLLDGQMVKQVCNQLGMTELGCATGTMRDLGPDFGLTEMLALLAGIDPK